MKKQGLILILALALMQGLSAQVALNDKGLYQENSTLFTGVLETKQDGHKAVLEIKDGLPDGEARYYYESGKLMEKGTFTAGLKNDKWTRYNEAGVVVGLAVFNAGKKDGTWMVWNDEGKKLFEMHYSNGEKTGTWYNWDANGQLISSKNFSSAN